MSAQFPPVRDVCPMQRRADQQDAAKQRASQLFEETTEEIADMLRAETGEEPTAADVHAFESVEVRFRLEESDKIRSGSLC